MDEEAQAIFARSFRDELSKLSATPAPPNPVGVNPNGGAKGQAPSTRQYSAKPAPMRASPPVASVAASAPGQVSGGVAPNTAKPSTVPNRWTTPLDSLPT